MLSDLGVSRCVHKGAVNLAVRAHRLQLASEDPLAELVATLEQTLHGEKAVKHLDVGRCAHEDAVHLAVEAQRPSRLRVPAALVEVVQVRLLTQALHMRL